MDSKTDLKAVLPAFREVVVVEGKNDASAVKRACRAQTIVTSGLGISREILAESRLAQARQGVVILTDPDGPGARIRQIIDRAVPGCKHAYIYRDRRAKRQPVGVECAKPPEILAALAQAKATAAAPATPLFTLADLVALGLAGGPGAQARRDQLGRRLGLGQTNGKQFLGRLNHYGVSRQEFLAALEELE
ncbi:MAG: ribonuclease M5 [Peptococcaceae bacterium]|jgi:ribonuclease M5|nr:ribonuclease M5 [Peptococcaceae bacterium]